ncbi:MAG: hypothetical protein COZ57_33950, partial [Armatimonadetes bacterium CG_4_8_14_3_um_filter_66_20]
RRHSPFTIQEQLMSRPNWLGRLFGRTDPLEITTDPGFTPPEPVVLEAAGNTDVGKARERNEDAFLCDAAAGLFLVCDGMGGHAAGDRASGLAVEELAAHLSADRLDATSPADLAGLLAEALQRANDAILALAAADRALWGTGSTAVIAVFDGVRLHLSNIGDSRGYLIRGGRTRVQTRDHSVAAGLVEAGQLKPEALRDHPMRNQLTAALGTEGRVNPAYTSLALLPGDRIVLCSDGLWDMVEDADIVALVAAHDDPAAAVAALIEAANAAGGTDNITAVVLAARRAEDMGNCELPIAHAQLPIETDTEDTDPGLMLTAPQSPLKERLERVGAR